MKVDSSLPTLILPLLQDEHLVLPCEDVRPDAHEAHSNEPAVADALPESQSTHAELLMEPSFLFFFPAAQSLQSVMFVTPVADEYLP